MKRNVLLVDDDAELLFTFRRLLELEGYHVVTASNGRKAMSEFSVGQFQLAVIDILLPDIRGDELAREIRKMNKEIEVILITGNSSFKDCIDALDLGICDILLKPIEPAEIVRAANEIFSERLHRSGKPKVYSS